MNYNCTVLSLIVFTYKDWRNKTKQGGMGDESDDEDGSSHRAGPSSDDAQDGRFRIIGNKTGRRCEYMNYITCFYKILVFHQETTSKALIGIIGFFIKEKKKEKHLKVF